MTLTGYNTVAVVVAIESNMLNVESLACERDRRQLFAGLAFSLAPGELVQVTGSNGSGKTTLLKILMGLYTEYEGRVEWTLETAPLYLGHRPGLSNRLTVLENLQWLCRLQGLDPLESELDQALASMGLAGYQDALCSNLSEGQRKRVNLARFVLSDNACWIMDEPFSSIDVDGMAFLQARMQQQLDAGGAILLTSHQPLNLDAPVRVLELN